MITRRGFMSAILALGAAPAIAKFPVMKVRPLTGLLIPEDPWDFSKIAGDQGTIGAELANPTLGELFRVMGVYVACGTDGIITMGVDAVQIDTQERVRNVERESWASARVRSVRSCSRHLTVSLEGVDVATLQLRPGDIVNLNLPHRVVRDLKFGWEEL